MSKTQFTERRQKFTPKRLLASMASIFVTFILLTSTINVAQKYFGIKKNIKDLNNEYSDLKQKSNDLIETNSYMVTAEGEEEALREKYNIVKPGEGMVIVSSLPEVESKNQKSAVSRIWESILKGLGIKHD